MELYDETKYLETKSKLQAKLDVLRKNKEAVGEEGLKTKYATAYKKLIGEIQSLWAEVISSSMTSVSVPKSVLEADDFKQTHKSCTKDVKNLLLNSYDIQAAIDRFDEHKVTLVMNFGCVLIYKLTSEDLLACATNDCN